jgi:hypothetical protein
VDASAYCHDLDWTGALYTPTLKTQSVMQCYGSLTMIPAMVSSDSGGNPFYLRGTGTASTGGINCAWTWSIDGTYTLLSDFSNTIYERTLYLLGSGSLNTNGFVVTTGAFIFAWGGTKTLSLGSSVVYCTAWTVSEGTLVLTANTSTINCSGNFDGGGSTYNIVNLTGATSTIAGSNTFSSLALPSATTQTISFTDGTVQKATSFLLSGSAGHIHTLQGTSTAGWGIQKIGTGSENVTYGSVSYSHGMPGLTWFYDNTTSYGLGNFEWSPVENQVIGPAGADGADGVDGADGAPGSSGSSFSWESLWEGTTMYLLLLCLGSVGFLILSTGRRGALWALVAALCAIGFILVAVGEDMAWLQIVEAVILGLAILSLIRGAVRGRA